MASTTKLAAMAFAMLALGTTTATSAKTMLQREPAEGELRLGQRVRVDDGSCPAGKIKEITATNATAQGIARTRACIKK
jgi:hypothetical protein